MQEMRLLELHVTPLPEVSGIAYVPEGYCTMSLVLCLDSQHQCANAIQ